MTRILHLASLTLLAGSFSVLAQETEKEVPVTDPGAADSPVTTADTSPPPSATDVSGTLTVSELELQVPDIDAAAEYLRGQPAESGSAADRKWRETVLTLIGKVRRSDRVELTLEEARLRALANSFAIKVESYNPAIETTRVVEAESAFDSVFFMQVNRDKQDAPSTTPDLTGMASNNLTIAGGLRNPLPTGGAITTQYTAGRSETDSQFQVINPAWTGQFQVGLEQPLLQGFGLDFNRSLIEIARLNHDISREAFEQRVRDTFIEVERAYWDLVRARREVVISARLLAEFEQILDHLNARKDFDVVPIQLFDTEARLETTRAGFVQVLANVRNAEDRLLVLMNDPDLNLAEEMEIIPKDVPLLDRLTVDRAGEVQTALDERPEIKQAKLQVDAAKVSAGRQENLVLPRLDATFRYSVDGIGPSADDSFDQVTQNDFHEYFVGVDFGIPIGNRGPRAAWARAKLQLQQAMDALRLQIEQIILDVNLQVRALTTNYDQIDPNYKSVIAAEKQVASIVARAERKDFTQLNAELNARQGLASSRRNLLQSAVDYNLSIMELERSKGTLLRYHNVIITDVQNSERRQAEMTATPVEVTNVTPAAETSEEQG